ncbi:MAG: 6-carboxytetrahydropterin synthase [Gemmatimonadetes bacterium]|nr:6-carboxytetrahydropterin synthase [Gemmatimonadota bacterium]
MGKGKFSSTKTYHDLPCAHRQGYHDGHCHFIHGYNREITFYFTCNELDENHFVVDFSKLKKLKAWLEHMFDHTMLINENDPEREFFEEMHRRELIDLRIMPNVGMEASSKYVFDYADKLVRDMTQNRCWVYKVETRENTKNSGIYELVDG